MVTRADRGSLEYLNYYNGREKIIKDSEYQQYILLIDIDLKVNELFKGTNLRVKKLSSNDTSSNYVYEVYNNSYDKHIILCAYIMKNSGIRGNSRKRMQIQKNYYGLLKGTEIKREDNYSYFFLGLYPINDKGDCVYLLLDNDGYSLNPIDSYSSLWVDFESIKAAAINGVYFGINKRNSNKYVAFNNEYKYIIIDALKRDDYSNLIANSNDLHIIDDTNGSEVTSNIVYVENYIPSRDAVVTFDGKPKIKKNSALREVAFIDAKYTCALCGKEYTFITNNAKMYFEAHHLIPCNINVQRNFVKKLDHQINLYCLCPECHRKIHLINSGEISPLIEKLYKEREKFLLEIYNIELSKLIDIYNHIDRRDEDNM